MSLDSRDQFEQAYSEDNGAFSVELLTMTRMGDSYTSPRPARAWYWWKRARAGIVVELPKPYAVIGDYAACGGGRLVWDIDHAEKITDRMCEKTVVYDEASLKAAGVKVAK